MGHEVGKCNRCYKKKKSYGCGYGKKKGCGYKAKCDYYSDSDSDYDCGKKVYHKKGYKKGCKKSCDSDRSERSCGKKVYNKWHNTDKSSASPECKKRCYLVCDYDCKKKCAKKQKWGWKEKKVYSSKACSPKSYSH